MTVSSSEEKPKRASRSRKTENIAETPIATKPVTTLSDKTLETVLAHLSELSIKAEQAKVEIAALQKSITETKENWEKEKEVHVREVAVRDMEEELKRKRDKEEYDYQEKMARKKAEDDFAERKTIWERELAQKKDQIDAERKELSQLRTLTAGFETDKAKAIKEAQAALTKELEEKFGTERKLREQEVKSDKDILTLKITSLTAEVSRQAAEIVTLKKAFDEATAQVKDIAVKVIEGRTPKTVSPTQD